MRANEVARLVIGAAIEVHRKLGPGLLESAYVACLRRELCLGGVEHESEVPISLEYKGEVVTTAYRADLLVERVGRTQGRRQLTRGQKAQLLTYLRMTGRKLGLLINFNEVLLKDGISRVVNGL